MIIIDYNGIAIGNIVVQKIEPDENLIRHMILNSIRMYRQKFKEYGEVVIVGDGKGNWRKDVYPQYKHSRKKSRDDSKLDWQEVFRLTNLVRDELRDNFPYKVLHVEGCEADDVIAHVALTTQEFGNHEDVMIVSADKDFIQLQKYDNIRQYSPMTKKFVKDPNPRLYLQHHIMKGDAGDGVPNVLSADDTFVTDKTQTPLRQAKINEWLENSDNLKEVMDENTFRNYQRNKKIIDLTEIPEEIQESIINNYVEQPIAMRMKVLNYLIKKRCNQLIEVVEEFYNG